jgi:putative redox protein
MTSTVTNLGGLRFMGETADGQRAMIDVSVMLGKRKLPVKTYRIEVSGERPDENPAPFTRIVARHVFDVPGLDREMAERFVDLATNKYCSVGASLNASVDWEVELLDATGASLGVTGPKVGATVGAAE